MSAIKLSGKKAPNFTLPDQTGQTRSLKDYLIIDGGNSFYKDTVRRFKKLSRRGIHFVDVGTSGGPTGARSGPSLMVGGENKIFKMLESLFKDVACDGGYQFFSGSGAGHFVKMVHNGIEYGMMQALAEGFSILKKSAHHLDLIRVARELGVAAKIIAGALTFRFDSQKRPSYTGKIITALREEFGGKRDPKLERPLSFRAKPNGGESE